MNTATFFSLRAESQTLKTDEPTAAKVTFMCCKVLIVLPRNTNHEEDRPMESRGEPAGRLEEEDEEEGCRETSADGTRQQHSNAVAEALVPEQDASAQEGEATRCAHVKHHKPPESSGVLWIGISFLECFKRCVKTLPWHFNSVASKQTAKQSSDSLECQAKREECDGRPQRREELGLSHSTKHV